MVLWFSFCDLCKHVVVSGKLGKLREEKREVGDQPGILSLKDGPFDWPEGRSPAPSGQKTGCGGSSSLHTSGAQGLSLTGQLPLLTAVPLGEPWWGYGEASLSFVHVSQYGILKVIQGKLF